MDLNIEWGYKMDTPTVYIGMHDTCVIALHEFVKGPLPCIAW